MLVTNKYSQLDKIAAKYMTQKKEHGLKEIFSDTEKNDTFNLKQNAFTQVA